MGTRLKRCQVVEGHGGVGRRGKGARRLEKAARAPSMRGGRAVELTAAWSICSASDRRGEIGRGDERKGKKPEAHHTNQGTRLKRDLSVDIIAHKWI